MNGGLSVMMDGILMMLLLSADNLVILLTVRKHGEEAYNYFQ